MTKFQQNEKNGKLERGCVGDSAKNEDKTSQAKFVFNRSFKEWHLFFLNIRPDSPIIKYN